MNLTLHIPDDLAQLVTQRVAAYQEPEIVTLPDGRKATTTRPKYTSADPLTEWVEEAVLNNLMAVAPEWFRLEQVGQADEAERQRKLREMALAKLKGNQ